MPYKTTTPRRLPRSPPMHPPCSPPLYGCFLELRRPASGGAHTYGKLQDHGRWRTQLARHAAERLNRLRRTLLHAHTRSVRLLIYQKRVVRLYKQSTPRFVPLCSRPVSALGHTAHAQNRMLAGSMSGSAPSSMPCIGSCSSKAVGNACPVRTYSPLRLFQLLPGVGGVLRLLRVHVSQRN